MHKHLFALSLIVLVFCTTLKITAAPKDGLYVGLGVGETWDRFNLQAENLENHFTVKSSKDQSSTLGDVFLGYGWTGCRFFAGLEAGTYFPRRVAKLTRPGILFVSSQFNHHLYVQDFFTLDALPGYRICPDLLVYFRGGLSIARLKNVEDFDPVFGVPRFTGADNRLGGRVGVGINWSFARCFSLGLDYFYTSYQKLFTTYTFQTAPAGFTERIHSHFLGLSLIFNIPYTGCLK